MADPVLTVTSRNRHTEYSLEADHVVDGMRVAFTGVSHWHLPLYLEPVLANSGLRVVGVADPDIDVAAEVAARAATRPWADWRQMCDETKPDFVFVLGRHCDMASVARDLIARGIPMAVEKPCGIDAKELHDLALLARNTGAFVAVPFVFRQSNMLKAIRATGEAAQYLAWKFVAGSNDRYRQAGCSWMLQRATSGGGCMLNLGCHFLDLSIVLLGGPLSVAGAIMSNLRDGLDVEDHGVVLLRGARGAAVIETGYFYPAPPKEFDLHFSIRTERHHFAAKDATGLAVRTDAGGEEFRPMPITNVPFYPAFVRDVTQRAAEGQQPIAGLADMAAVMDLTEAAYRLAPLPAA
jgi:predicted dehydrogenase